MPFARPEIGRWWACPPACYALPAVPLAFLGLPLYVHLPAHYAALPSVGLAAVGVVLLLARLLDLVTDPLVGLLVDRVRGRISPQWLMTAGGLLMAGGVWWLFQPGVDATAWYLFATLSLTYLGWTLFAIPYYAIGADIGVRRGQAPTAALREAGMIAGTVAALLLPALFSGRDALTVSAWTLFWLLPPALLAAWLFVLPPAAAGAASEGLAAMWRRASPPARQLLVIHWLNALAGGTAATLFILYTHDVLAADESASGMLLLTYFAAGLLALPLWVRHAARVGLVRAWRTAMLLAALGFAPAAFLGNGDQLPFVLVCIVTGATLGADIALPAALQAQIVVDESRAQARPRGGALFGLWGMAGKLALACSAGLALPLLAWLSGPAAGFTSAEVTPWLYAGLPALIKLAAVLALRRSLLWSPHPPGRGFDAEEEIDEHSTRAGHGGPADAARRV